MCMYIYIYVCVCVCVFFDEGTEFLNVNVDKLCKFTFTSLQILLEMRFALSFVLQAKFFICTKLIKGLTD
jgi:hypothetical protein